LYLSNVNLILIPLSFGQPYVELANTYGNGKIAELEAFVKTNEEKFESVGPFTYLILICSIGHFDCCSVQCLTSSSDVMQLLIKISCANFCFRTATLDWLSRLYHPCISGIFKD